MYNGKFEESLVKFLEVGGNNQVNVEIYEFGDLENYVVYWLYFCCSDFKMFIENVVCLVFDKDLVQGGDCVQESKVKMLEMMCCVLWLLWIYMKQWIFSDIVICVFYVGVGMMDNVVFLFLYKGVVFECVYGKIEEVVYLFVLGECFVISIVYNVEVDY